MVLGAVACFATLDTATKAVTATVPVLMAVWFRYLFQAVATTAVVLPRHGLRLLRTQHPRFQVLRGVLLLVSSLLAMTSLRFMPVGEFTAIVMITPLAITLLSAFLGEHVSGLRWLLVLGGFAGTLVIIRPGGASFDWQLLLPLGVVVSNACFQVLTSRLARTEAALTTHLYTGWVGVLLVSLPLGFFWTEITAWQLWAGLLLMGLMGTVGHFLLILGYARASPATLTPYLYAQIGFAMLGGWLAFSHVPDNWSLAGMLLVALCGAAGAWLTIHERRMAI